MLLLGNTGEGPGGKQSNKLCGHLLGQVWGGGSCPVKCPEVEICLCLGTSSKEASMAKGYGVGDRKREIIWI